MQKIIPFLWFDDKAEEAVNFYTSIFKNSKIGNTSRYDKAGAEVSGRKEGSVMTMEFELEGFKFSALNGGPIFKFTPAISFFVGCESVEEVEELYTKLIEGGVALMPLDNYGFSEKFGWVNDKYGVSWQINMGKREQKISPYFLFTREQYGKAEEAMNLYTSLIDNSKITFVAHYEDREPKAVMHATFTLGNEQFIAMDSNEDHKFGFTEAVSLLVNCESQEEVDKLWNGLSASPESEQCGWLKDKYGVSWQIVPTVLSKLLSDPDPEKAGRVMKAMLSMKKIEIKGLKDAYQG